MKTAVYIENGYVQVVLTPESDWERKATEGFEEGAALDVRRGSFYHCQGGWTRHGSDDKSIMLTLKEKQEQPVNPAVITELATKLLNDIDNDKSIKNSRDELRAALGAGYTHQCVVCKQTFAQGGSCCGRSIAERTQQATQDDG